MTDNFVSIISSIHKNNKYFEESIKSILNQTHSNFEFLIMQDGSVGQEVQNIIQKYQKKDTRIKTFQNLNNIGLTKSLNNLIKKSNSKLILRHDLDDISLESRLEKQLIFMEKNFADACFTRAQTLQTNKILHKKSFYMPLKLVLKLKNPFIHGSMLIKKSVIEEIGSYDEKFKYAQDYKLYIDLLRSNKSLKQLNEVLYLLNTEDNISTNFKNEQDYYFNCAKYDITPK